MNKRAYILITIFILCLFSCCGRRCRIDVPTAYAAQGDYNVIKIYVDRNFNLNEELLIEKSLNAWKKASNNLIKFKISYQHIKPGKIEDYFWIKQFDHSIFIWKIQYEDMSKQFNETYSGYAGFWDLHGNIFIFTDRINDHDNELYRVMVHESGHMLGLKHIEYEKSVMQPRSIDIADCITKDDANRLCLIYGCKPKPECE